MSDNFHDGFEINSSLQQVRNESPSYIVRASLSHFEFPTIYPNNCLYSRIEVYRVAYWEDVTVKR